jgi:hypothetical protein
MVGVVSRLLPVVGASLFVLPLFPAQTPNSTDLKYQSPPEVMVKLVDAPLTPAISLSPAHGKGPRRILIEQSSPLPTIVESWYGTDHPETAANLTALAQPLTFDKQEAEAQSLLERALTIQKHVNGPVNSTVATTQNRLGILAFQRKQFDVARNYFTEAMNTWKQLFGEQYPSVAVAYSNLGSVCLEEKNFARAVLSIAEVDAEISHKSLLGVYRCGVSSQR